MNQGFPVVRLKPLFR